MLFGLEGTDPDKNILRTRAEILTEISKVVKFPINQIDRYIDDRLSALSKGPDKQINHHTKDNKYCLPYATRFRLDEQRFNDAALYEEFQSQSLARLNRHLSLQKVQASQPDFLLNQTFNQIFRKQGLDFSDFVLHQKDPKVVETVLPEVVISVLDAAGVPPTTRTKVALALQGVVREIIYRGTSAEHEYLRRPSRSYMLLFLVQCDPHVCSYFDTLASKLRVFVCNSILVPVLSEICVPSENRRFWNLLVQARNSGVKLFINGVTLNELVSHIRAAIQIYRDEYYGLEDRYSDDRTLRYVKQILIRAYLYQKVHGEVMEFDNFIDKFVSPRTEPEIMAQELITFFQHEFGIEYQDDSSLGITSDPRYSPL